MGPEEANDARRSCTPRMASTQQLVVHLYNHIVNLRLVIDEAQPRAVEGKRPEPTAVDAKVPAISADYPIDYFTPD